MHVYTKTTMYRSTLSRNLELSIDRSCLQGTEVESKSISTIDVQNLT